MKYAGAGWLPEDVTFSPLGVRVANVLGQVYLGIYHIDQAVLKHKEQWALNLIDVTIYGELATYDFDELSRLVFCCLKAGVNVNICGSFKGYTKLTFKPGNMQEAPVEAFGHVAAAAFDTPEQLVRSLVASPKELDRASHFVAYSVPNITWPFLGMLIVNAHANRMRVALEGRSPQSLEMMVSQRKSEGSIYERHPLLDEHIQGLKGLWDIDYGVV